MTTPAGKPVAQIYLDLIDDAFKRGLSQASKDFEKSATNWNAKLEIVGKGFKALAKAGESLFKVGKMVTKDVFGDLTRMSGPLGDKARDITKAFDGLSSKFTSIVAETPAFQAGMDAVKKGIEAVGTMLDSPMMKEAINSFFQAFAKGVSLLIEGLMAVSKFISENLIDTVAAYAIEMQKGFSWDFMTRVARTTNELNLQGEALDKNKGSMRSTLELLKQYADKVAASDSTNTTILKAGPILSKEALAANKKAQEEFQRDANKSIDDFIKNESRLAENRMKIMAMDSGGIQGKQRGLIDPTTGLAVKPDTSSEADAKTRRMERNVEQVMELKSRMISAGVMFSDAIGASFAAGISAAVTGTDSFLGAMKKSLGQVMITLGTSMITLGTGALAAMALGSVFPPLAAALNPTGLGPWAATAAIAAGGVLVAAGSAMSGAGGAARAAGVTSRGGAGSGSAGSNFAGFGGLAATTTKETTVVVNFNSAVGNERRAARSIQNLLNGGAALNPS